MSDSANRFNGPYIEYYGPVEDIKMGWVYPEVQDSRLHAVIFLCPCNCGELVAFPTQGSELESYWKADFGTQGLLTMTPSIKMESGCKSHYTIRNGMVEWC